MQETWIPKSDVFITEAGFLVILSGGSGEPDQEQRAGVGFIVAPCIRNSIVSFRQVTARMASLKIRVSGGKAVLFSAYAPHSGYEYQVRQSFFHELGAFVSECSSHGPKLVFGDMNSKLYKNFTGEDNIVGPHIFRHPGHACKEDANRHLLIEMCTQLHGCLANTFFDVPEEQLATNINIGCSAGRQVGPNTHSQIDFLVCQQDWLHNVLSVHACSDAPLSSHHLLLEAKLHMAVDKSHARVPERRPDLTALSACTTQQQFSAQAVGALESYEEAAPDNHNVDLAWCRLVDAFHQASERTVPKIPTAPRRPWISSGTLGLIERRNKARREDDKTEEKKLAKLIKTSVAKDRAAWLEMLTASGDWGQIRKLRKGAPRQQGRLCDANKQVVDSDRRANTLAAHLEQVQWAVRPTTALPDASPIKGELMVDQGVITDAEVRQAARKLKRGRAGGMDEIPPEFWKTATEDGMPTMEWITRFCNLVWSQEVVPQAWHKSKVRMIYKKGDPALCDNYRPISLLPIGYKIFAAILLQRLKKAGAEDRIWKTQFGFRTQRGTADAIFVARRILEDAWSTRGGQSIFLALDWAKAFDSVSPCALVTSLLRFGCPGKFARMVGSIYENRSFVVADFGQTSSEHRQHFGICQGCPLSPFLFTIVMTTLLTDAYVLLREKLGDIPAERFARELIYADDTLLIDSDPVLIQELMRSVEQCGSHYGLQFNWKKLELMGVRSTATVLNDEGTPFENKQSLIYLGTSLSADGRVGAELGRRLGAAASDFKTLHSIWSHSRLSRKQKIRIFNACVVSKLTYSLFAACLNKAERRRLDSFQNRCLRKTCRVPPAYISRVSNAAVLEVAAQEKLSEGLARRQMLYMAQLARRPADDPVRCSVFEPGTVQLRQPTGPRRRGRPRQTWGHLVMRNCMEVAGSHARLADHFRPEGGAAREWELLVRSRRRC